MGTELSETLETDSSPLNSPDSPKNGTAEFSPNSTRKGNGEGDVNDDNDDLGLNSLPAIRSSSTNCWSRPWTGGALESFEPKLYGGCDTENSDPDWITTWGARNDSKHNYLVPVSRNSSKLEPVHTILSWSDVKEPEVELDTKQFYSSEAEWEKEEEEEPVAVEDDNIFANSLFCDDESLLVGAGLANLGNTCFLNAVLQCFMHIVPLVQSIQAYDHPFPCDDCTEGFCVLCALKELMNVCLASKGSTISPKRIVNNLSYFSSTFQRSRQEDAHEFLQCFLDRLGSCCNYPKLNGQVSPEHENVVKQTFGGHLISKLQCCNCGHRSDTYESLVDLSLEIEDVDSLYMALDSFTKVERIEDPETKFTCEKCEVQVSIEKQLLLDEAPLVATFHLKRFKNDGYHVEKIDKHVIFPLELDLLPYVERDQIVIDESKYNLFALVVHIGGSSSSGHYYCFVQASPDAWYKFDDSKVTRVQEDDVMSQEAYILFYVKQGTPWFSEITGSFETQQLLLDASASSCSPQSVLYSVDLISNLSSKMETDRPCDEASAENFSRPNHNGIDRSDGKENSNVVSSPTREGVTNSSVICLAEAAKTPPPSVLKERNSKREFGISIEDLTTETLSRSPSPEKNREDTADPYFRELDGKSDGEGLESKIPKIKQNLYYREAVGLALSGNTNSSKTPRFRFADSAFSPPRALLRSADEVSCKNRSQKHPGEDQERKQASSLVKKNKPSSRGSSLRGSHSEGCTKKRRRSMEVSPIKDRSSSTSRRSNNSSRLRPLTARNFR